VADRRPRVVGLAELLRPRKPLREKPAPLVYFSDKEFARLIKGAAELKRRPRAPARSTHGAGVYLACVFQGKPRPPENPCRLLINPTTGFRCSGNCKIAGHGCRLARWTHPTTGRIVLECRCERRLVSA
jgi:hypothetical protein